MASRRELLARIGRAAAARVFGAVSGAVSNLGKETLERLAERMEAQPVATPPPPPPPPRAPARPQPTPEPQPEPQGAASAQQRTRMEAEGLLGDLQALNITTRQIVERLTALGYRESAEAIYRVPDVPNLGDRGAVPALPPAPPEVRPKQKKKPLPEVVPPAQEAKYRIQGSLIHVPFTPNLRFLYRMLASEWTRIGIGKKKDGTPQPDGNAYAADAILQAKGGSTADAGVRIPPEVLGNEDAFVDWAKSQGYDKGGSIVVDGMIPPPGGAFAGERVWTVDAERYRHLDTDKES